MIRSLLLSSVVLAAPAVAQERSTAPAGIVLGRTHRLGEVQVSAYAERLRYEGLRRMTTRVSTADAFALGYSIEPLELDDDQVTVAGELGLGERLSVLASLPYHQKWMHLEVDGGPTFQTRSQGLGDLLVTGLLRVVDDQDQTLTLALGLSLPTGSIEQRHDVPGTPRAKLPYAMQLGSGTFDFLPSATYEGRDGPWSFGAQGQMRWHTDVNDEGYRLGNWLRMDGWLGRDVGLFTALGHLRATTWDNIEGRDPELDRSESTLNEPLLQAGTRLDASVGFEYHDAQPGAGNTALSFEIGIPLLQTLDGPQLERDWSARIGWRLAF